MRDDLKLRQSNNLILATHKMNANQMRIFFYACSQYKGDLKLALSFDEMNKILNPSQGTNQKELLISNISTMMKSAFINLKIDEDDEYCEAPVFIMARKKKNEDIMRFEFNPHIAKELEELRGYTWMYLSNLTGMSSAYAIRIYEFLAMRLGSNNKKGTFDFDLNKLRIYLDCVNKYARFDLFEMRVLKVAKAQINEKTNIKMSYKKIKTGRSVTSIKFSFGWKSKDDFIDVEHTVHDPNEPPAGQMDLEDYGVEVELTKDQKEAMEMLKEYD